MPKTKILIALLLMIAILSLIIGCPVSSDDEDDDPTTVDKTAPTLATSGHSAKDQTVTVTFSETIKLGTAGQNAISITGNTITEVAISAKVLTITVETVLVEGTKIKVTFGENAIADTAGNALVAGDSPEITIAAATDTTPPTILDESSHTAKAGRPLIIRFSEAIQFDNGTLISNGAPTGITVSYATVFGAALVSNPVTSASITGTELTLDLTSPLVLFGPVKVDFTANSIKDLTGNHLTKDSSIDLTTADTDTTPPTVVSSEAVAGSNTVTLTFSENIAFGSGANSNNNPVDGITIANNTVTNAIITNADLTLTVQTAIGATGGTVTVTFVANAITDTATPPNSFATGDASVTITAAPDTTPPTVVSSEAVAGSNTVTLTFSENIAFGSGANSNNNPVDGITIANNTVTNAIITNADLTLTVQTAIGAAGGTVTVTFVANAITDTATPPNSFATGDASVTITAAPDTTPPTVVSSEAVAGSNTVTLTFSENIAFGSGANSNNNPVDGITIANNTVTNAIITNADLTLTVQTAIGAAGGTVTVTFVANAITDTETPPNSFATGDASVTITAAPDTTPPTILGEYSHIAKVGRPLIIRFSEAIQFDNGTLISNGAPTGITVSYATVFGPPLVSNPVTSAAITGSELTLELTSPLVQFGPVKVDFTANSIKDFAGNHLTKDSSIDLTTDSNITTPVIVNREAVAGSNTVTLSFSEYIAFGSGANSNNNPVDGITIADNTVTNAIITNRDLILTVSTAIGAAGGTVTVTFVANAITSTETPPVSFAAGDASVTITADPDAAASDTTPPIILGEFAHTAKVGRPLIIGFNEPIQFDNGTLISNGAPTGITVSYATAFGLPLVSNPVTSATIIGSELTLELTSPLVLLGPVKVDFTANSIKDLASNHLSKDSSIDLTTAAIDITPPTVVSSQAITGSNTVRLTFSEDIAFGSGANSNNNPVDGITIANNTVTSAIIIHAELILTVQTAIGAAGETVTVTFATDAITDTEAPPNLFAAGDAIVTITQ